MNILDHIQAKKNEDKIVLRHLGRDDLARALRILDFKRGAEIGCAQGYHFEVLCKENPQMHFYAIDAWKPYGGYSDYMHHRTLNGLYNQFKERMQRFKNHEIIRAFSQDALVHFEDESLDYVYIDANHDDPWVTQDVTEWAKKVRSGGIVAGHDYVEVKPEHTPHNWQVKPAIDRYVAERNIKPLVILKKDSHTLAPSWMFFKP